MSEENTGVIVINGKRYVHGRTALSREEQKTPEKCKYCAAPPNGLSCVLFGYQCLLEGSVYWVAQPKLDLPREKAADIPLPERATCPKCRKRFRASTAKKVRAGNSVEDWCPWCAHEETAECGKCGELVSVEHAVTVAGKPWCKQCVDTHTIECQHCHKRIPKGSAAKVNVSGAMQDWCTACSDADAAQCHTCGEWFAKESLLIIDRNLTCHACSNRASVCSVCGNRSFRLRDDGSGSTVCPECLARASCEAVHDYHGFPERNNLKFWKTDADVSADGALLYLGFELEAGGADSDERDNAARALHMRDRYGKRYHMERDSTIPDYGFELISSPHTLEAHRQYGWKDLLRVMRENGMRSHDLKGRCGLHVHVSRSFLSQGDCIRLDMFALKNRTFWERIARRSSTDWSKFYDKGPSDFGKTGDRHSALNFRNANTVEFRMFRGTLKYETLMATLAIVDGVCRWIKTKTTEDMLANSGEVDKFIAWLKLPEHNGKYDAAVEYAVERSAVTDPNGASRSAGD